MISDNDLAEDEENLGESAPPISVLVISCSLDPLARADCWHSMQPAVWKTGVQELSLSIFRR